MCSGSCFLTLLLNETVVSDSPLSLCSLSDSSSGLCSVDGLSTQSWFWSGPPPPRTRTKGVKLLSEAWRGPALHLKGQQLHSAGPPFNHTQHYSDTGETSESSSGASAEINWWSRSPVRLQISWWSQWESAASCWPSAATTTNSSQLKQLRSQQITDFININIFIKNVKCCMWGDEYDQRRLDL